MRTYNLSSHFFILFSLMMILVNKKALSQSEGFNFKMIYSLALAIAFFTLSAEA